MFYIMLFYAAFIVAAMVVPTLRVYRKTGLNPLVLPNNDSVDGFVGLMFKLVVAGIGVYLLLLGLGWTGAVGSIALGADGLRRGVGWALMILSLGWVVLAQVQMGTAWRIGIDTEHKTALVAAGLFRFSRNPIFLGMLVQLLGLFLLQPDAVTLTVLTSAFLLISVQIRLEEAHLMQQHGETYRSYAAKVRRWL
jgi:protein-S-isoprenylcysteine O-methyltransferase Ste14